MFGLGRPRSKSSYGALFDISSESVGVAIVKSETDAKYPKLIFSHRIHMRFSKEEMTVAERIRSMKEALLTASLILSRDGVEKMREGDKHARVTKMLVSCSAPWSYTISRNVLYEAEKDLKITRELINDLVGSAEIEIENHVHEIVKNTELTYDIVERATIDVRINDYPISHPLGLKGKELSLVHVTGLIPREVIVALNDVEEKVFPGTTIRPHTFMLMLYCVLREMYEDHTSMTIVHVTGETTEFGIVEGDTLIESLSVPVGLEHVVRNLMQNNKDTSRDIYSQLSMYQKNELNEGATSRVKTALSSYATAVSENLTSQVQSRRFPKTAFVLAPTPYTSLFSNILEPFLREKLLITNEILNFKNDILETSPTHDEDDAPLAIAGRFFHKLQGCGEIGLT